MKEFKSFLKTVGGNEGDKCNYPTRLDTYGCGCSHDCKYCYAKSLLDFRKLWNAESPSVADFKKVLVKVPKLNGITRLGGMTDCFQPCEAQYKVTRLLLQAMKHYKKPYLIVTKSPMVATDEYIECLDKDLAHIQITVTSTDPEVIKRYENAPAPEKRIEAIEKLDAAGFDVCTRVSPFVNEWIDKDRINAIKCNKLLVEFLRVNTWIERWMDDVDFSAHTLKQSGYRHLPLETKIEMMKGFDKVITVCEDVDEHHKYWQENVNPNKDDCCNLSL